MVSKAIITSFIFCIVCFGQALPDRDELAEKFKNPATSVEASLSLVKHFQMGGLRTMIRNLNELEYKDVLKYGPALRHTDLTRFANDLNNNLQEADGPQTKAFYLSLLSTVGRGLAASNFEPYVADETLPMYVRLAAASALVKVQNPAIYDRFLSLADQAVVDPTLGKDDLRWADINKSNTGFFLYTKGKLSGKEITHGMIITAIAMAEAKDTSIYEDILENVSKRMQRDYYNMMIDHAIRVGGVQLLDVMAGHKRLKKYLDTINTARGFAQKMADHRAKLISTDASELSVGPVLPEFGSGTGVEGFHSGYAIAKISASGDISLVDYISPFGGTDDLKQIISGKTFPAHNSSWEPTESHVLVIAP